MADKTKVEAIKSKVLILEDDETLGLALKEVLTRDGHMVFWVNRPDEALQIFSSNKVDYLFCDCLLPQMTGIDFVEKAKATHPGSKFKTILMSGIYTDKQFVIDATKKTQAVAFLQKPFDLEQVLKLVKKEEAPRREELGARKLLYQMFSNAKATTRQKRKVIESIEEVSGFDLPFIYSLLVETSSSGYLNIYNGDGSVSGISFSNGMIVSVDVDDKTTFLGEMLIQSGYVSAEAVQMALREANNRRIGNYLIQNNKLSPHAFDLILTEQMNIRLVRTIVDQKIRINFAASDVEMTSPNIDADTLQRYLHDWIASKISVNWLKNLYMMWSGNIIVKSAHYSDDHPALQMPLIKSLEGLTQKLGGGITLNKLLETKDYTDVAVYKGIYFLLTRGLITFAPRAGLLNDAEQLAILRKTWEEFEHKNTLEIAHQMEMGAMNSNTPDAILEEFMGIFGDPPKDSKSEGHILWMKIRRSAEEAMSVASDSQQLNQHRQESLRSEAESKLKASSLMDDVKKALHMNQFTKAVDLLKQVSKLSSEIQHLHIYNSWARVGLIEQGRKDFNIKEVEMEIMQVPPDERYDALYPFVTGLILKAKGDLLNARKSFEKSAVIDASFIPARRELTVLASQNKKQDVFNMPLSQMVSGFFKKR